MERTDQHNLSERVPGWGSDSDPSNRPGVPFPDVPHKRPGAHFEPDSLPQQEPTVEVLKRPELKQAYTPVFGTSTPPRLVSGMVKRLAYRYPDHMTRRWMLLLMSDRIDVMEGRLERVVMPGVALGVALGCMLLLKRMSARY